MPVFGRKQRTEPEPEVVIDLRDRPARPVRPVVFGLPAACPDCGGPGYLDHVDLLERVMFQHCPACSASWKIAEADILAGSEA